MPRKATIPKSVYAKRSRELRRYGFNLSFRGNKAASPQQKAAVSRAWNAARFYTTHAEANRIDFKRFRSRREANEYRNNVAKERLTPGGVFIQRPKGVAKGEYKISIAKGGGIKIRVRGKKVEDIEILLDMVGLATDSKKELQRVLKGKKRPRQLLLTVNGYDATSFEDLEAFNRYIENDLIPHLRDAEFDFDKWGKQVFGLRLVYSGRGRKKVKDEGKEFDFKSGGIFDASSKRLYGRKKYTDRRKWAVKKGRRKGT